MANERVEQALKPLIKTINTHPLYMDLINTDCLKYFMEQHVFIVWDFMCLIKSLYARLVTTSIPWLPPDDGLSVNLISHIIQEEESDIDENHNYLSHFEIYINAMKKINANTQPIDDFIQKLREGENINSAIDESSIHHKTKKFVLTTFSFFDKSTHELASAFVYGREGITLAMFLPLLNQLERLMTEKNDSSYSTLIFYLKRHIQLDNDEHFPKATKMLINLVGSDKTKWKEIENAAITALNARIEFLSALHTIMRENLIS